MTERPPFAGSASRLRRLAAAALLVLAAALLATPAAALDGGRYGEVRVMRPVGKVRGYAVWFSDRGGWTATDQTALAALAGSGVLAVGVDLDVYLARIAATDARCDQLVGDAEGLSRQLQRREGGGQYAFPILAGAGAGGTLAIGTLAQAPVNTLAGAISIDPVPTLPGKRPLCAGLPSMPSMPSGDGFAYGVPPAALNGFWIVGLNRSAATAARIWVEQAEAARIRLDRIEIGRTGTAAVLPGMLESRLAIASADRIKALPLIELAVDKPSPVMVILISGDGGWRDLDKTIAEDLQRDGIPVVGWDSVRYFWTRRTARATADDLAAVIAAYAARWRADRVALVGYSFGANVIPFAYDLLPAAARDRVALLSLLALESRTDWEIQVTGWLGAAPSAAAVPVEPVLARVPPRLIQCFYGAEEKDTLCPALATAGAEVVKTSGGHHFDGDYARLARRIRDGLRRRAGLGVERGGHAGQARATPVAAGEEERR